MIVIVHFGESGDKEQWTQVRRWAEVRGTESPLAYSDSCLPHFGGIVPCRRWECKSTLSLTTRIASPGK